MDFVTAMLKSNKHLILALPSVIIPREWNYIINPRHKDIQKIQMLDIGDVVFDVRLKA